MNGFNRGLINKRKPKCGNKSNYRIKRVGRKDKKGDRKLENKDELV